MPGLPGADEPGGLDLPAESLSKSSGYLAWGSTLLLSVAVIPLAGWRASVFLCLVLTIGAVAIHAIAWAVLYQGAVLLDDRDAASGGPRSFWNPRRALKVSTAVFIGASLTLPFQVPAGIFSILILPYVPFVFGPVVLSHAYFFLWSRQVRPPRRSERMRVTGAMWLIGVSILGIVSEAAFLALFPPFSGAWYYTVPAQAASFYLFYLTCIPVPAGLTAIGYWLVHFASRKPQLARESGPSMA